MYYFIKEEYELIEFIKRLQFFINYLKVKWN